MQNPSQGVHRELLPHVHCLSTFRYPVRQQIHLAQAAQWLKEATDIAQSKAAFFWTYLDRPADGTIFLSWQPLDALGTGFASDGYVWPPQEQVFSTEVEGGYILEVHHHKSGYGPGEQFTAHARFRYRLLPPRVPNGGPPVDSSLWLTLYCPSEPADRVPSSYIPMNDPRIQQTLSTRAYLQQQGAIVRKEFMLRDPSHWPQIQWPQSQGQARGGYGGPIATPQRMAYPPHAQVGPPSKRARTNANSAQPPLSVGGPGELQDDEEETSRGDLFDHMTPREISLHRYKQNHRWLEEVIGSPYAINQITPVDLGLGLKGSMSTLTDGIFYAPSGAADDDDHAYDYVGRLDEGKADEFRKRVEEHIKSDQAEMEKMKKKHEKRLAKMKRGSDILAAEKSLRSAAHDPSDVGQEYWRLEGRIDEDENGEKSMPKASEKVDTIVAKVEASFGRHVAAVQELLRIQDGGYEEASIIPKVPSPDFTRNDSQQSGVLVNNDDTDMGDSAAAGLLDQFHTGFSANSTPAANFPSPSAMLQTHSSAGTPRVPSPAAGPQTSLQPAPQGASDAMQGMETASNVEASKDGETAGDWVVVPKGGVSPTPGTADTASAAQPAAPITEPESTDQDFDLNIPDDFNDLGDLDTAGDALASFGDSGENNSGSDMHGNLGDNLGTDLDFSMGNDDVDMGDHEGMAFDDAFEGVEPRTEDGEHTQDAN